MAPADSGKSWVVQHFEEAERLARESLARAMREARASDKEMFDLARFERLLNRGPQARREKDHLHNYYVMRPEHRTLQSYVNELLAGEPWDQLAVAATSEPSSVDGTVSPGTSPRPLVSGDFRDARVRDEDFTGAVLEGSTWTGARVSNVRFDEAVFANAILDRAVFERCSFRRASFSSPELFAGRTSNGARFTDCDFAESNWNNRDMSNTVFVRCKLAGLRGRAARIEGIVVRDCDLGRHTFLQRRGWPEEVAPPSDQLLIRRFWVEGHLSSTDLKFGKRIETSISSTHPPTESEASSALGPIAEEEIRKQGGEGWAAYSITYVQVTPQAFAGADTGARGRGIGRADAPMPGGSGSITRTGLGRRVDLRLVALTERRHPTTHELAYQVFKTSEDGDAIANVFVCADRIELDDSKIHTSPTHGGAVECYTPKYQATIRRGEPGWPDAALTWIRVRFGDAVASEVDRVIHEAGAFRE